MSAEPSALRLVGRTCVQFDGRKLAHFSGCDYYRLSSHHEVLRAALEALKRHGLGVSASRVTTGNHELYLQLERALTGFFQAEAALLMPNGYVCATAVAQTLADQITHALIDERAHACLFDAARFLKCPVFVFRHRSPDSLAAELHKVRDPSRLLLLTDGMFAHDGSVAPLKAYRSRLPGSATLLVDDAHGAGVLGAHGRGALEHEGIATGPRVIQTITLSKAFGAYGGAVLGTAALRKRMIERARVFVGSTPVPLPMAAAALRGVELVSKDRAMRLRLRENSVRLRTALTRRGIEAVDMPGPIVRLELAPAALERTARALLDNGVFPPVTRYLGAAPALRVVVSSEHTAGQLNRLVRAISEASR